MTNFNLLLKIYIISSIFWFIFMLNIITVRLINSENVNNVFGFSLVNTTLYVFEVFTILFISIVLYYNKIYFSKNILFLVQILLLANLR